MTPVLPVLHASVVLVALLGAGVAPAPGDGAGRARAASEHPDAAACPSGPAAADPPRVRRHLQARLPCGVARPVEAWPTSGYYIEFRSVGETFFIWVASPNGIDQVTRWLADSPRTDTLGVPGGPIELETTYNPGYSYRLAPGLVRFAAGWIEVCDAAPCYVEENPVAWLETVGTWCPWRAMPRAVWNCTGGDGTTCGPAVFYAPYLTEDGRERR